MKLKKIILGMSLLLSFCSVSNAQRAIDIGGLYVGDMKAIKDGCRAGDELAKGQYYITDYFLVGRRYYGKVLVGALNYTLETVNKSTISNKGFVAENYYRNTNGSYIYLSSKVTHSGRNVSMDLQFEFKPQNSPVCKSRFKGKLIKR